MVPLKPSDQEGLALSNHPEFLTLIAQSRREIRAGRAVSLDSIKRQFLAQASPHPRLQPAKAHRRTAVKARRRTRLRG